MEKTIAQKTASRMLAILILILVICYCLHRYEPPRALASAPAQITPPSATRSAQEIAQLLAPIALYPDPLLSQVLIASTYPIEVVEADRWVKQHPQLKGEALADAVAAQHWDASLKALTATPDVLAMMARHLEWTQKLGDAMLAQQADIMRGVQRLRKKAHARNALATNEQQNVSVQLEGDTQVITIEPAQPNTLYVPYYNPTSIYGPWEYPEHPAYHFPPALGYATASARVRGVEIADWGNKTDWASRAITVNGTTTLADSGSAVQWKHDPAHRHGVQYQTASLQEQFGQYPAAPKVSRDALKQALNEPAPSITQHASLDTARGNAFAYIGNGDAAWEQSARGKASLAAMHPGGTAHHPRR